MNCPKCKNVKLKSKKKDPKSKGSHFACIKCGGIWTNQLKLEDIYELEMIEQSNISNAKPSALMDSRTGLCPEGHGIMIRAKVNLNPPFYLERCSFCGGIWFDKGELNRIVENHLSEDLSVIWTLAWQRKASKEKEKEYYLELNKKLLGDELFELIINLSKLLKNHPEQLRALSLLKTQLSDE